MNPLTEKKIKVIQSALGVTTDGIWGPKSQTAFDELVRPGEVLHVGKASSFADPEDVNLYLKYYSKFRREGIGHFDSIREALKFGDNGLGCWGDDTTGDTPACALTKEDIIRRWGSLDAGKHKLVEVATDDTRVICVVKDIKGHMNEAIIDLNPGACKALGLTPPIMASCSWRWAS